MGTPFSRPAKPYALRTITCPSFHSAVPAQPRGSSKKKKMMTAASRLTMLSAIGSLLLAGCAHEPAARSTGSGTVGSLPDHTGIAACDDYLSSYLGCHRAADIFPPDQLPARYQTMRTSLLRDSRNPATRPQLAARCNSLAAQLRQSLHGKSCDFVPTASASGTP